MAKPKPNAHQLTRSLKMRIYPLTAWSEEERKTFYQMLNQQSYIARNIANETVRVAWLRSGKMPVPYEKDTEGYHYYCAKWPDMAPSNVNQVFRWAKKKYRAHSKAIFVGDESLISFRKGSPILLNNQHDYKLMEKNGSYEVDAQFLPSRNQKGEKQQNRWTFGLSNLPRDYEGAKILKRLAAGELHRGQAAITKKKGKWYFILSYSIPQEETAVKDLLDDRIMGIDLGVVKPAYYAFTYHGEIQKDRGCIDGDEIAEFRRRVEHRRQAISRQFKWSNRKGHGLKRAMEPVNKLGDKIRNFQLTCNQRYAHFLVKMAVKHRCKHIQMEDLSGINKNSLFLKYWTYYSLQEQIKNQAEKYGLDVTLVKPAYTSQRCPICGHIESANRQTQEAFTCQSCGYGDKSKGSYFVNADYNAACNIATPHIDEMIADYVKSHLELKKANNQQE